MSKTDAQRTAAIREAIAKVEAEGCVCAWEPYNQHYACSRCEHLEHLWEELLREAEGAQ